MLNSIKLLAAGLMTVFVSTASVAESDFKKSDVFRLWSNPEGPRLTAMRTAAQTYGAQKGYLDHMRSLKNEIKSRSDEMDSLYDFGVLMRISTDDASERYLVPPIISTTSGHQKLSSDARTITITDTRHSIERDAMLTTEPPNWRQYLIYDDTSEIIAPASILTPDNKVEEALWLLWEKDGYNAGVIQAEREMITRIRRLGRDFKGIVGYMTLLAQNKISKPVVVKSQVALEGSDQTLNENVIVYKLAAPSKMNSDQDDWVPLVGHDDGDLNFEIETDGYNPLLP